MAGVSSRTLRHYHDIGLLVPASVGSNGYRYYAQEQLLRLQQILLLRELDLGLEAIAEVLAGHRDQAQVLRQHEQWLRSERHRLGRLADTVAHTITSLEGGTAMSAPELFEGFADRQAQAEQALAGRYGEGVREHFATARERTKNWSQQDYLDAHQQAEQLDSRVLELMRAGVAPDAPQALDVIQEHHHMVTQHWTPNRDSYTGLGQLYVEDPQYRARYDAQADGLAEYLRDAIAAYASQRLT